jgi:TonB family protein
MRPQTITLLTLLAGFPLLFSSTASGENADPALVVPTKQTEANVKLEPPQLVHFVSATYPEEALASRLTAQVVLSLEIDATGKVVSVTVQDPRGHGFDEAAQSAAMAFVFRPAMKGDKAIPSRILYRYDFTLKEDPPSVDVPQAPVMALLVGRVEIGDSKEPLASATVKLTHPDGHVETLLTDTLGRWQASDVAPGNVHLHIEASGFSPWDGQETLESGERLEVAYRLRPPVEGLEVTVRGERQDREVTKRTIEREQLAVIPGTGGDAIAAVQTMPGVGRAPGFSGMIISRGSGPQGTQLLVDGLFTPQLYHFGGLTSIIPTEMIESIDFYPGNFSAKYGRASGGILDVKLREMQGDGKYHGLAQVDLIDARVLLRGPVPFTKSWNFEIAARRSHLDAWLAPLMESSVGVRTAPVYYDWQGFVETRPTAKSYLRFGVFGSDDRLALVMKDAISSDPGFGNSFSARDGIMHFQAVYRNELSEKTNLSATASVGKDSERMAFGSMLIDEDYVPITMRGEFSHKLRKNLTVRVGPDIVYYHVDANVRATQPPREGQPDPGPYSTQPLLYYKDQVQMFAPAGYVELEWLPTTRLKFLLGNRLDYFNLTDGVSYSPRLNARYDIVQGPLRTTLKAAAGRFTEYPPIIQLVDVFGSPGLKWNPSEHYSVGFEQDFSANVDLSVEGFYKNMSNWSVAVDKPDKTTGYENIGAGTVYGLETLLRWKPTDRFFGWVAYTLSHSTRKDGPKENERLFEYDQTHNLTVLGSYKLGRGWQLGGRFRYVTGNPFTPCTSGILQAAAGTYSCRSGDLYSSRLPAFHQLDVRVDKTWTFSSWKLTSYLDLQNAYNRSNPEGVSYNYNYTKPKYAAGLPIIPSLGLRGEF